MANARFELDPAEARRFAGLLAGFDTGTGDDTEALAKALAMRRIAAKHNTRIVDVLEMRNVRLAVDDQLQPVRAESEALLDALDKAEAYREELTERICDVGNLAEMVEQKEEAAEALRRELAVMRSTRGDIRWNDLGPSPAPRAALGPHAPSPGAQSWLFEGGAVIVVAVLLLTSLCSGRFFERSESNGLAKNLRPPAALVRKGRPVLPVPKPPSVHRRLRRSGTPARPRQIRQLHLPPVPDQVRSYDGQDHRFFKLHGLANR